MTITVPKTNANLDGDPNGPLDVWLRFDNEEDPEEGYAANTFYNDDTGMYRVEWDGGVFTHKIEFYSYHDAQEWLETNGYTDYTVEEN